MGDEGDENDSDPRRFAAEPEDIKPLGKSRIVDLLTDDERARNAEHDKIVDEATKDIRGQ